MATLYSLGAVTVDGYRVHTGDRTTAGTVVSGALVDAEQELAAHLRRDLALQARTKSCPIYSDGRCYPPAWPITVAAGYTIDGRALLGATPDLGTFTAFFPDRPERVTVTWTGGFDDGANGTRLPVTLRHAVYDLAKALAQDAIPVPVGAGAVSVGDVSIQFRDTAGSGDVDALVPGLSARVRRYRNRWV